MSMESVEKIAEVVLYEGYLLYPYTRSALKNQQRWTLGGVYPRVYSEISAGDDPWLMQTQCVVVGSEETQIDGKVRFLQIVDRHVATKAKDTRQFVDALRVGEQVYRPWEEAIERTIAFGIGESTRSVSSGNPLCIGDLLTASRQFPIDISAGIEEEPLIGPAGDTVGVLVREWQSLQGVVKITAERLPTERSAESKACYRLTVQIRNETPWKWSEQEGNVGRHAAVIRHTCVSTHTILHCQHGEFVSLLDPPAEYRIAAASCENRKTWPVLAGPEGERHFLLSSPIILYDYPQVSPESPGNLFDTTEIDELLTLSIMTLTDEEKQEMRESDPRAREILERTESLSADQLLQLHGSIRSLRMIRLNGEEGL